MTAIVTTKFRVVNATNFKEDIGSSSVYIGIGKSDAWSNSTSDVTDTAAFEPSDSIDGINSAYQNMIGMKKLGTNDISHVIPRHNWTSGRSYVAWDSDDQDIYDKAFYIITDEFKVYKCIQSGSGASTVQPVATGTAIVTDAADGYHWKYMFTLSVSDAEKFLTNSYLPVKTISLDFASDAEAQSTLSEADYAQYLNQKNSRDSSTAAGIERVEVTAGGTGYTSAPTVLITGDGTGATATAEVSGGQVTSVAITAKGTNYTVANISFSGGGGSDAAARGVIAPAAGHGVDPVSELGAFFVGLNTLLSGSDDSDLTVGNDFRQVTLIKSPIDTTFSEATAETLKALKGLTFSNGADAATFLIDEVIESGSVRAFVDSIDPDTGILYYHQNEKTGYGNFSDGDLITGETSNSTDKPLKATGALIDSEVIHGSGDILFVENRAPINRSVSQLEDIKLVIEF